MPKPKPSKSDMSIRDDPRPMEPALWNTLRVMVHDGAIDPAWRCALYRLHRNGFIDTEQREAGDSYWKFFDEYKRWNDKDPDCPRDVIPEARDAFLRKMARLKERRSEIIDMVGLGRGLLDSVIIDDVYPSSERQKVFIRALLQSLAIFFKTGRKKSTRNAV